MMALIHTWITRWLVRRRSVGCSEIICYDLVMHIWRREEGGVEESVGNCNGNE